MLSVLTDLASTKSIIVLAVVFQLLGLITRNELRLRLMLLTGSVLFVLYYLVVGDSPIWEAVIASALLGLANMYALTFVVLDRSTLWMSAERRDLFKEFPTFTPGQFRRIMQHAQWHTAANEMVVCRQGAVPEGLYFLLEGGAILQRDARTSDLASRRFIGEMSFLRGAGYPANATVTLKAGSRFVVWDRMPLMRQISSRLALHNAFMALFNRDLLLKLDQSWPEMQSPVQTDSRPQG